jgi:hypothetical protein
MMTAQDDNSGVFVAFPDREAQGYDNPAYTGGDLGFEIQIDELARPNRNPVHRTGAIYAFQGPDRVLAADPPGVWTRFDITIDSPEFLVERNGELITRFRFRGDPCSPHRGLPSTPRQPRFIGLQSHTGVLHFPQHRLEITVEPRLRGIRSRAALADFCRRSPANWL